MKTQETLQKLVAECIEQIRPQMAVASKHTPAEIDSICDKVNKCATAALSPIDVVDLDAMEAMILTAKVLDGIAESFKGEVFVFGKAII